MCVLPLLIIITIQLLSPGPTTGETHSVYNFWDDGNKNPSQTFCLCKYLIGDPHGRYQYQYFNISSFDNTNIGSIFYNLSNINVKFVWLCSSFPNVTVSGSDIDVVFQITEITARQRTIYYPEIKASH